VAATVGAGVGIRKAGRFLGKDLNKLGRMRAQMKDISRTAPVSDPKRVRLGAEIDVLERTTEGETLKRVLGYSGGGLAGTAALGNLLESIRRANNATAREE
jgi:hypothetical protein